MSRFCRIDDGFVSEIIDTDGDIHSLYHPDLVLVPHDGSANVGWGYSSGVFFAPERVLSKDSMRELAKSQRAAAVGSITVEVGGKVFDGDEMSQTRMARAIIGMNAASIPSIQWTLADNSVANVTVGDLTEALVLAGTEQTRLWCI